MIALLAAAAAWGTGTVLSKQALASVPPLLLLPIQLAVSVLLLELGIRLRPGLAGPEPPARLGRLGILNPGLAYALGLVGLSQIDASVALVIWGTEPMAVAILGRIVLGERLPRGMPVMAAAAVAGIVLIAGTATTSTTGLGIALIGTAVLACAIYSVMARAWLPGVDQTFRVVILQQRWALGFAVVAVLGIALAGGARDLVLPTITPAAVAFTIASGFVYYGAAYAFYLSALRHVPAGVAAVSFYLIPIFGLVVAAGFGDRLEPRAMAGAAIVLAAVMAMGWSSWAAIRGRPVDEVVENAT